MNHNSFPVGEDIPKARDGEDQNESLSFEEHTQIQKHNAEELAKPSLKNAEHKDGAIYIDEAAENASKKIKAGEKLDVADITEFIDIKYSGAKDEIAKYLADTGFEDGTDYDIKLPGFLIMGDGTREKTPLSVSFNNGIDFTKIDFYKDVDSHEMTVITRKGEGKEGMDVGDQSPTRDAHYKPRFSETKIFEDGRYKNVEG